MLCIDKYSKSYIDSSRKKIQLQLKTYKNLVTTIKDSSTIKSFEPNFFNHLVLALDYYFVHRSRTLVLNEGNPCNEVRMLCHSILNNNDKLGAPYKNTVYNPDKAILKYKIGDEIKLTEEQFSLLYKAFFVDIENKFL